MKNNTIEFSELVAAMENARNAGFLHATLYRTDRGKWAFGVMNGLNAVPPQDTFLLPIVDIGLDEDDIAGIAEAWIHGQYTAYPVPADLSVHESIAEASMAELFSLVRRLTVTFSPIMPCVLHPEKNTEHAAILPDDTLYSVEMDDGLQTGIKSYHFIPICEECRANQEKNIDALQAIAEVQKILGR